MRGELISSALSTAVASTSSGLAGAELASTLALAAAGTLASEDLTLIAVGGLVAQHKISFVPGVAACFVGIFVGDLLLFLMGRWLGARALGRAPLAWFVSAERVARASAWLERRGAAVVFLSRFTPGLRLPTYFACGAFGTSIVRFSAWFALAALVWTPLVVALAAGVGGSIGERAMWIEDGPMSATDAVLALGATIATSILLLALLRRMFTHKGRRLLASSWRRLVRFEYWPAWALYAPVVVYIGWLALRHRSARAFTASNPALPCSGIAGESKGEILAALSRSSDRVPATTRIRGELPLCQRRDALGDFMRRNDLALPIVLKPDVGERGRGVVVARTVADVERALAGASVDLLAQAYVDGPEFGVFYVRDPRERRGRIFSITEKHLPHLAGDGHRTLEELILADERALGMARFFLASQAEHLTRVPAAGERVRLGELGTHCRGATFLDGAHLATPALERAVDELSRGFPGFFFGRYDVRAPSIDAFREGRFRVLELNGVTSEATHIYDPRHTVFHAWRTLMRQWALAFEIGAVNARGGARVATWRELIRIALAALSTTPRSASAPIRPVGGSDPLTQPS